MGLFDNVTMGVVVGGLLTANSPTPQLFDITQSIGPATSSLREQGQQESYELKEVKGALANLDALAKGAIPEEYRLFDTSDFQALSSKDQKNLISSFSKALRLKEEPSAIEVIYQNSAKTDINAEIWLRGEGGRTIALIEQHDNKVTITRAADLRDWNAVQENVHQAITSNKETMASLLRQGTKLRDEALAAGGSVYDIHSVEKNEGVDALIKSLRATLKVPDTLSIKLSHQLDYRHAAYEPAIGVELVGKEKEAIHFSISKEGWVSSSDDSIKAIVDLQRPSN